MFPQYLSPCLATHFYGFTWRIKQVRYGIFERSLLSANQYSNFLINQIFGHTYVRCYNCVCTCHSLKQRLAWVILPLLKRGKY